MTLRNVFNESAFRKNPEQVISEIAKFSDWLLSINNIKEVPATFIFNQTVKKKLDPIIKYWLKQQEKIKQQKKVLKQLATEIDVLLADKKTQEEIKRLRQLRRNGD